MSSVTFFIPKNCKASGATSAIVYGTYQHEKYTCLECTLYFIAPGDTNHRKRWYCSSKDVDKTKSHDDVRRPTKRNDIFKRSWRTRLHDILKCYTIRVFPFLGFFPTTFVTMVICLVNFPFPLDVVLSVWAIPDSREMKQNVWKSIEWVFRIIQIGSIERTQNIFHKSLKCTSQFWNVKNARDVKQRDSFGAKFYLFDASVHEKL